MNHSHLKYRSPFDVYIKVNGYIYIYGYPFNIRNKKRFEFVNDFAFTPSFRRAAKTHLGAYLNAWVLSAAAWFPETPSCYTAKHPIALPKI